MTDAWVSRTSASDNNWLSVCYGNGLFVAVSHTGTGGLVMTSPDGSVWTNRASASNNHWKSVCYGNGLFVAVSDTGSGNRVMTSPDGINWTTRTSASNSSWSSVCYGIVLSTGNGLFVAIAHTGTNRVMTSPDGFVWSAYAAISNHHWNSVCYGNGLFVAVADSGANRVMTSPDGIVWTSHISATQNTWISVCYGTVSDSSLFVAVSHAENTTDKVMTSQDGSTWTIQTAASNNNWNSVCYGDSLYVAVSDTGTNNRVMTSSNGVTWTSQTSAANNNWHSVCYENHIYVAVSDSGTNNRVMTSGTLACYLIGTKILCLVDNKEEYIAIENIKKGYLVKTYNKGYKAVKFVGKKQFINNKNDKLNCLFKHKETGLTVSGGHSILVDELPNNMINMDEKIIKFYKQNYKNEDKLLLLSCNSELFEQVVNSEIYTLYHVALESSIETEHYGIYADGVLSESIPIKTYIYKKFENTG